MKTSVYVIFDRVAEESGPLFEAVNDGIALRNFKNVLENVPSYQRGDYRLFKVGEYTNKPIQLVSCALEEVIVGSEE